MDFVGSVRAVAGASGEGVVDWDATVDAAKRGTDPGDLALTDAQRTGYEADVRAAGERVGAVAGVDVTLPEQVQVLDRHHWIDVNVPTFRRLLAPLADETGLLPGVTRVANTGSLAFTLSVLARNVLGQYDPPLFADGDAPSGLYFVHPNLVSAAESLDVDEARFRRWVAFHEVTHAAEFTAAPWLVPYVEARASAAMDALAAGDPTAAPLDELQRAMTAVEGYAELLMDEAFDGDTADLRAKLDARRRGGDPVTRLLRRVLGLGRKREQYERGREFFAAVASLRDMETAARVWDRPENLPTEDELDDPLAWADRVA